MKKTLNASEIHCRANLVPDLICRANLHNYLPNSQVLICANLQLSEANLQTLRITVNFTCWNQ